MHILYLGAYWRYIICFRMYLCWYSLYMYSTPLPDYYKVLCSVYLVSVMAPIHKVTVPFIHILIVHTDLEMLFHINNHGSLWPWLIYNVGIAIDSCEVFTNHVFCSSADICIANSLYDWLGLSCLVPKLIGPEFLFSPVVRTSYCKNCCR